jgi:hypothetical protein
MGQNLSSSMTVETVTYVNYLVLNGVTYTGVVYNGTVDGTDPLAQVSVLDSKTTSGINGALGDIVTFYSGKPNSKANMEAAFNSIISAFGPPPTCDQAGMFSTFPIQCASVYVDSSSRRITFQITSSTITPVGTTIGSSFEITFNSINSNYLLPSDTTSRALNFFVPDYFVQAQNDNILDVKKTWSYMPNFDLALHTPATSLDKKCRCEEKCRKCHHKPKPYTTTTDLHSLLSKIYNIAHLVELGGITPASGEAQVQALWLQFAPYEVKDVENFKLIDVSGDNGIITMLVRYRLLDAEILVAMSITGTYLNGLFFNVSTIPISGDNGPDSKHAFNKAIGQFNSFVKSA